MLSFLQATRQNLGNTAIGLLRADAGFFADEILKTLEAHGADYVVAAKSTAPLQAQLMLWRYEVVCATLKVSALEV